MIIEAESGEPKLLSEWVRYAAKHVQFLQSIRLSFGA